LIDSFAGISQAKVRSTLVLAILVLIFTIYFTNEHTVDMSGGHAVFSQRDFTHTPFDLMDAYDACLLESKAKLGAGILRAHMLPLSTRYQPEKGTYLVVLSADVGSVREWSVVTVYCTVDPKAHEISYYKEVHDGQSSVLSRTMSALSELISE
jgi:hypothetical protein